MAAAAAVAADRKRISRYVPNRSSLSSESSLATLHGIADEVHETHGIRKRIREFQHNRKVQLAWSSIIILNFLAMVTEEQIDPKGSEYPKTWMIGEAIFTVLFSIELVLNGLVYCFRPFLRNPWLIFDVLIVTVAIWGQVAPIPPALSEIRSVRVLRILRLLDHLPSLRKITCSIGNALPYMMNAFAIALMVMSVYALVAVDLFHWIGCSDDGLEVITARGQCVGEEYFGNFARAFGSLFQVMTGDAWSEAIARPMVWAFGDKSFAASAVTAYFVSFQIISSLVLLNVSVAILTTKLFEYEVQEEAFEEQMQAQDEEEKLDKDALFDRIDNSLMEILQRLSELELLGSRKSTEAPRVYTRESSQFPASLPVPQSQIPCSHVAGPDVDKLSPHAPPMLESQLESRLADIDKKFMKLICELFVVPKDGAGALDRTPQCTLEQLPGKVGGSDLAASTPSIIVSVDELKVLAGKAAACSLEDLEERLRRMEYSITGELKGFKQHLQHTLRLDRTTAAQSFRDTPLEFLEELC